MRAGPAWLAAAVPVSTKMPVPMIAPMPSSTSARASRVRCSSLPMSASCSSPTGLVENSRFGMWRGSSGFPEFCGDVRAQALDQRLVYFGGARDHVAALAVLPAAEGADAATGLGDEQRTRGRVPGIEADLPEPVDAAGRHVGEVERC